MSLVRSRMLSHVEMHNAPAFMGRDNEHVWNPKASGRHLVEAVTATISVSTKFLAGTGSHQALAVYSGMNRVRGPRVAVLRPWMECPRLAILPGLCPSDELAGLGADPDDFSFTDE